MRIARDRGSVAHTGTRLDPVDLTRPCARNGQPLTKGGEWGSPPATRVAQQKHERDAFAGSLRREPTGVRLVGAHLPAPILRDAAQPLNRWASA
jgi:hypothetical protein